MKSNLRTFFAFCRLDINKSAANSYSFQVELGQDGSIHGELVIFRVFTCDRKKKKTKIGKKSQKIPKVDCVMFANRGNSSNKSEKCQSFECCLSTHWRIGQSAGKYCEKCRSCVLTLITVEKSLKVRGETERRHNKKALEGFHRVHNIGKAIFTTGCFLPKSTTTTAQKIFSSSAFAVCAKKWKIVVLLNAEKPKHSRLPKKIVFT